MTYEKTEENPQRLKEAKTKTAVPTESEITKYGFLYFGKETLATLGWQKGDKVKLQQTPDGLLITKTKQGEETCQNQE